MMASMTSVSRTRCCALLAVATALVGAVDAQTFRDHTRDAAPDQGVSEEQAVELTLTLVQAARTNVQTWVRTAGALDESGTTLRACVRGADGALIEAGQRVRAFSPESKSSIYQARVTRADAGPDCVLVEAQLSGPTYRETRTYVMEIIVDLGERLAIPNEAIIEEGDRQVVYVQMHPGHYVPQDIRTGLKGELYTEVLDGLAEGAQVVTIGSFFIDADHKLKSTGQDAMGNAHQHH